VSVCGEDTNMASEAWLAASASSIHLFAALMNVCTCSLWTFETGTPGLVRRARTRIHVSS
jgi:hypothetical protein